MLKSNPVLLHSSGIVFRFMSFCLKGREVQKNRTCMNTGSDTYTINGTYTGNDTYTVNGTYTGNDMYTGNGTCPCNCPYFGNDTYSGNDTSNGTSLTMDAEYCYEWVVPVLLAIFMLITNILLLNLLIAIFK